MFRVFGWHCQVVIPRGAGLSRYQLGSRNSTANTQAALDVRSAQVSDLAEWCIA
jgi:hypothetical protein